MVNKKFFLFLLVYILFFKFSLASANVLFSEVMYDTVGSDSGREWIEVYNDGPTSVDFSTIKLFESDTNHKLIFLQGEKNIPPSGYAIIVSNKTKFNQDWPTFSGTIFDSTFSLNNSGEILILKDKSLKILDTYSYKSSDGGAGNGKTMQKIDGIWQESRPTLGMENKILVDTKILTPVSTKMTDSQILQPVKSKKISQKQVKIPPQKLIGSAFLSEELIAPKLPISGNNSTGNFISEILFIILLVVGAVGVYFIRNKKSVALPEEKIESFEILEE